MHPADRPPQPSNVGAVPETTTELSLGAFCEQWIAAISPSLRPTTADSYAHLLATHVVPRLGCRPVAAIGPGELGALYAELLSSGRRRGAGGLSPATVRYVHLVLRHALADAVAWGYAGRNVAALVRPPRVPRAEIATWSPSELARFLRHVSGEPLYPAFVLAATTGMRRGEVLGLQWQDIDLDRRRAFVRRSLVVVRYKVRTSEPKTARGRRAVALDEGTVKVLRDHRRRREEAPGEPGADDLVFADASGAPVHPIEFARVFSRRAHRAGLRPIRFHDLRHTYASIALQAGVHPKVVSERLGHASVAITLDTYSHVMPSLQEEAAERVAALILGA